MILAIQHNNETSYITCKTKAGRAITRITHAFNTWYNETTKEAYPQQEEALVYFINHIYYKRGKTIASFVERPTKPPKKSITLS